MNFIARLLCVVMNYQASFSKLFFARAGGSSARYRTSLMFSSRAVRGTARDVTKRTTIEHPCAQRTNERHHFRYAPR